MTLVSADQEGAIYNPLDLLEEVVGANDWPFSRASQDEMLVQVTGRWGAYRLFFYWEEQLSAVQFTCQFDQYVSPDSRDTLYPLLALINERLWLGHIDLDRAESMPTFRYTALLRGAQSASVEVLEDLMDIAVSECDRFYPAIQFVIRDRQPAEQALRAAITDTLAEA